MLVIGGVNSQTDTALRAVGQSTGELCPCLSAVGGFPDPGVLSEYETLPVAADPVLGSSIYYVGIGLRNRHVNNTSLTGYEQRLLPVCAVIGREIQSALVIAFEWNSHGGGVQLL